MDFECIVVGGLDSNCYLLKFGDCGIVIDPGAEPQKIISAIDGLRIEIILATHRHYDHTDGVASIKLATNAPAAIHVDDWIDGFDQKLADGQIIDIGDEKITVIHTPGHTPGGCCFLSGNTLFSGDTLFPGGPGNTSFPGGDEKTIIRSIRDKLLVLPDYIKVYPGHGPATTIGQERSLYENY